MGPQLDPAFEGLLEYVRTSRGFDFTGYKRSSLTRRMRKRMHEVGIDSYADYQDYLEVHPDEFMHLFNTILINVTSFFRDPEAWDVLAEQAIPRILEHKGPDASIRAWSVGCASGEEAYTLAMVLAEAIGGDGLRERLKVYATDVDEEALAQARAGTYSEKDVEAIPPELRAKYLTRTAAGSTFRADLRRAVIFGRHDLVHDAPISRVDVIACRNTLMYFNLETQSRIYGAFHFALNPEGVLLLGKSETLLTRTEMFVPFDLRRRVFSRRPVPGERATADVPAASLAGREDEDEHLRSEAFESATLAQIVLDDSLAVVAVNPAARRLFGLSEADLGRPFHELEVSYRPLELRSRIERTIAEGRPKIERAVREGDGGGEPTFFDVEAIPLLSRSGLLGVSITFNDVSRAHRINAELEKSRGELETAYEELQSTVEELETTNEELQSTNEELETTNEELQSTNEELETMNEELQSTNEELETINRELQDRTSALNRMNVFFESILEGMRAGVIVLDRNLTVESWNSRAEDMWGLRTDEVRGQNLFALDIGLPAEKLRPAIRGSLGGAHDYTEIVVDAVNRRGRPVQCKVVVTPMTDEQQEPYGVILVLDVVD